jgi:hypothetical protein
MTSEAATRAVKDGSMPKLFQTLQEKLRPEAAYFYTEDGQRTALWIFDMKESSQMPMIAEPLFSTLGAKVQFAPVMNAADLKMGLETIGKEKEQRVPAGV